MTYDHEAIIRHAYHTAEGGVTHRHLGILVKAVASQIKGPIAGNGRRAFHHPVPSHTWGS